MSARQSTLGPAPDACCRSRPLREERVNRSLKMADSQGSVRLIGAAAAAVAPVVAPAKSPLSKQSEAKRVADNRSQSSREFNPPPPPKKVRVEERSVKPRKVSRDGGVGGNCSGRDKLQQAAKQQGPASSAGLWSFSPVKSSGAVGGPQPPTNPPKVFKQSDFFLHKPPSSAKTKKPSQEKQREKEREKAKGGGEEKKKHLLTPGSASYISNSDISRFNNISVAKRANGEVMLPPKGRPSFIHLTGR